MRVASLLVVLAFPLVCTVATAEGEGKRPVTVAGTVKSIDVKGLSITLEGRKREGGQVLPDQTFKLAADVKVTAGKDAKTLADVKAASQVTLSLSEDKSTVTAIILPGKKEE